jgi:hypothetical protein
MLPIGMVPMPMVCIGIAVGMAIGCIIGCIIGTGEEGNS